MIRIYLLSKVIPLYMHSRNYFSIYQQIWVNSTDGKFMIFFLIFFLKIGFDIPCKLSPKDCQKLLSGKNKTNITKCCLLKSLLSMQSIKNFTLSKLFINRLNCQYYLALNEHNWTWTLKVFLNFLNILTLSMQGKKSADKYFELLLYVFFSRQQALTFHANFLLWSHCLENLAH